MEVAIGLISVLVAVLGVCIAYLQLKRTPETKKGSEIQEMQPVELADKEIFEKSPVIQGLHRPWSFFETAYLASPRVKEVLVQCNYYSAFAIDNSIMLYLPPHFGTIQPESIDLAISDDHPFPLHLENPDEKMLLRYGAKVEHKQI